MDMTAEYETTINALLAENDKLIKLVDWQNEEIERLRDACKNASSYISVRDQFAMAALTGLLSASSTIGTKEGYCRGAYEFADAMIKTRTALGEKE